MLLPRVLTGAVLILSVYLLVFYGNPLLFSLVVAAAILLSLREFYALLMPQGPRSLKYLGMLLAPSLALLAYLGREGFYPPLLALGSMALFTLALRAKALKEAGFSLLGVLYLGLLLSHLVMMRRMGPGAVFLLFLLTWAQDVGSYLGGTWMGRWKLSPNLSPGKTVEGFICGILLALMTAVITQGIWLPGLSTPRRLILAGTLALVGPLGDLFESMIKRAAGVKDSGRLFPGHGGLLDRLDSLIFTAPFAYYYLNLTL